MSKRALSLLLALALSSAALASCGSAESQSDVTSTSSDASDETTPESVDSIRPLGGTGRNRSRRRRHQHLVHGERQRMDTDIAGEQTGDVLDDAVYWLNLAVQEKLNCNLNLVTTGRLTGRNCGTEISTLLLADDTSYDAFFATQWSGGKLVLGGALSERRRRAVSQLRQALVGSRVYARDVRSETTASTPLSATDAIDRTKISDLRLLQQESVEQLLRRSERAL